MISERVSETENGKSRIEFVSGATEYSDILHKYDLEYTEAGFYWQVGDISWGQGWILHLSVIPVQVEELLLSIIPILIDEKVAFRVIQSKDLATSILNGQLGLEYLGKVVAIYPINDESALRIALILIKITQSFKGPKILTDRHLGTVVYTRYGAGNAIVKYSLQGEPENFIYSRGNLIKDEYYIPFVAPSEFKWPFDSITSSIEPKIDRILQSKYKPYKRLKEDARGNVYKSLNVYDGFKIRWCVIKEGKRDMLADDQGRDIRSRLHWQFELHNDLFDKISIPKAYSLFEENENFYLVLEFIRGTSLHDKISNIFKERPWFILREDERSLLKDYVCQILDIIQIVHDAGYVHRDINPANFIVSRRDRLVVVDLELMYSYREGKPDPAFRLGTEGFMSPEQEAGMRPTVGDDIYAIGALMISMFTGILPIKFCTSKPEVLKKQVNYFIRESELSEIISRCFAVNREDRPSIELIKKSISENKKLHNASRMHEANLPLEDDKRSALYSLISSCIRSLPTDLFIGQEGWWKSKTILNNNHFYYQATSFTYYGGFYVGVGGVMYTLACCKSLGVDIALCLSTYIKSYSFLKEYYLRKADKVPGGLASGTAGIALALAEGVRSGILQHDGEVVSEIGACLENTNIERIDFENGIAGQGMALIRCLSFFESASLLERISQISDVILNRQNKDGSWGIGPEYSKLEMMSFDSGSSGILCFLLAFHNIRPDDKISSALEKGLDWLIFATRKYKKHFYWFPEVKYRRSWPGFQSGLGGVVLCLLKAYQVLKKEKYANESKRLLDLIPSDLLIGDFTLKDGLVGGGEMYLEAAAVLNDEKWKGKADQIYFHLLNQVKITKDDAAYWMMDTSNVSTADFAKGNCGAIYFLLRYLHPGKLKHPLLNF